MLVFNNTGLGELQLGKTIEQIPFLQPFNDADRKLFLPSPDSESWYKYTGECSGLGDGKFFSFPAQSIYLSVNKNCIANHIWIHPNTPVIGMDIAEGLRGIYGIPSTTAGGMGNLQGTTNYTFYFYVTADKSVQVAYHRVFNIDYYGPEFISFHFLKDMDALFHYRLTYRSWKK
ncbi:MAG TPA: hypothetical protein VM802_06890 [Chitinophaga sp.]|uniref:hypothetical protein n=1 Tax=Chitinophaga sp. TaxID=1869181 RepID=UPI002CE05834|nr:hypothetical protein [Chitinophaga sp.]HVI44576.1 hypothetical protein [Chitinophaga sp.]